MAALTLLLSVGLAGAIIAHKEGAAYVPLLPQEVGSWPISVRPPDGWVRVAAEGLPSNVGMVLKEPGGQQRVVVVVRGPELDSPLPSEFAARTLDETVQWVSEGKVADVAVREAIRFGPLPGIDVQWLVGGLRRRSAELVHGCVGVTPQGRVFGLLMRSTGRHGPRDARLLRHLAEHVSIADLGLMPDVARAAADSGMALDAPRGTKACLMQTGPVKSLRLINDSDPGKPWAVTVTPLPLVGTRTPRAILGDLLRNMADDPKAAEGIETVKLKEREAARGGLGASEAAFGMVLWVVPAGQTAYLLDGRHTGADAALTDACRMIADTIRPADGTEFVNVSAAKRRGEELLNEIREKRVDVWLGAWSRQEQTFLLERDGRIEGYYRQRFLRPAEGRSGRWRVESELQRNLMDGQALLYGRHTLVDRDGVAYETIEVRRPWTVGRVALGRFNEPYRFQERRAANSNTVRKTLRIGKDTYQNTFTVDAGFACDPVLTIACWLAAQDPQRRPAIVAFSDRFEAETAVQVLWPLGEMPVPGGDPPGRALALVVQADSAATAYTLYFDPDGRPTYLDLGGGSAFRACTEEEFNERFPLTPSAAEPRDLLR